MDQCWNGEFLMAGSCMQLYVKGANPCSLTCHNSEIPGFVDQIMAEHVNTHTVTVTLTNAGKWENPERSIYSQAGLGSEHQK